ncbi:MAG: hypothetical protein KGY99_06750 [Phycisphaerae bacterium]|nr:hypothetical protein [Phycisphaerae bacterium]
MPRTSPPAAAVEMWTAPTTRAELKRFVRDALGIVVPDRRVCRGHNSPLDYLAASFFDQQDLLVWACRGGGKTYLAAVATLLDAVFHAPAEILVLGGSFDQSDRLAVYVRALLRRHPTLIDGRMTRERVRLTTGSEIRMLAQSQQAVRGQHVQKIRCDEVDLFAPDIWRAVQFATRSRSADGGGDVRGSIEVLSTLHRPGGLMQQLVRSARRRQSARPPQASEAGYHLMHWCLWEVIERCPPARRCERCPLAGDCVPPGADWGVAKDARGYFRIDDAVAIQARSSRPAWETEMLCRGAQRENLVFAEFDPARHVRPLPPCLDWPMYRAIDFGYTSPLVCLWIQITPGGRLHVVNEYVRCQLGIAQQAVEILRRDPPGIRPEMTYVDPAGRQRDTGSGDSPTEILAAAGIPCTCRASTVNDGVELIRAAFAPASGAPTLAIDPTCEALIDSLASYHYPPAGQGRPDVPVKDGPDHAVDALRYFFVNRFRPKRRTARSAY